jgi:ubiquinone/menaquinone biosynthesis C-methylase UbiE
MTDNTLSTRQAVAHYDRIARVYDLIAGVWEDPARRAGVALFAAAPGERVLELGCGTGRVLPALAQAVGPTGNVEAVDLSDGMLRVARARIRRSGMEDRVTLRSADARRLPYADASFDGVFMSFTLELFATSDIPRVLAECRRVLRPGGRLVVVASSREDPAPVGQRLYEWTHRHVPRLVDCRPIDVARDVGAAGFRIEREDKRKLPVPLRIVRAMLL